MPRRHSSGISQNISSSTNEKRSAPKSREIGFVVESEELDDYHLTDSEFIHEDKKKRPAAKRSSKRPEREETRPRVDESVEDAVPEGFEYIEISIADDDNDSKDDENQKPKVNKKSPYDRHLGIAARHFHLFCLSLAYRFRVKIAHVSLLKAKLLSLLPPHLHRQFTKEIIDDGRTLINALSMIANWWKNNQNLFQWFRLNSSSTLDGDESTVLLFFTLIETLGLRARYVVSLQPLLVKPTTVHADRCLDKVPKYWCEVWHEKEQKWVVVDCVRALVNDRLSMEPPPNLLTRLGRQHLFIFAFESSGKVFDVTRRYCSRYYGWTYKLRRSDEDILGTAKRIGLISSVPDWEEDELSALIDGEPLPVTIAGFQGHGRYMLERQLHKYEVFFPPDAGIVGKFRGENVRLRSVVQKVRSKEAWYTQQGRVVNDGEIPAKVVKLPKKPVKKARKNMAEWEKDIDQHPSSSDAKKEYVDQPLWGEWQTVPFQPAVAENGTVPRNKFGNVDLYLPSMLPIGCVWISDDLAWQAAKDLQIDYAAACTRFTFSGRFAAPRLQGIIICAENEGMVLRRLNEIKVELLEMDAEEMAKKAKKEEQLEKKKAKIKQKILQNHKEDIINEAVSKQAIVSTLANKAENAPKEADFDNLF